MTAFQTLDANAVPTREFYAWMISAIIPRPIAFISTVDGQGVVNLAPFSFFNGVCSSPPCLSVSITPKRDGSEKDTLRNIDLTGEFIVNTVSESILAQAHQCSAEYPYGVSELQAVGLTAVKAAFVSGPPRVAESPVQIECRLEKRVQIGEAGKPGTAVLVIGRILGMHIRTDICRENTIDWKLYSPVARLGGDEYGFLGRVEKRPRPKTGL